MSSLVGKVVLVTGGGSGLGRAGALALARAGAQVLVGDVTETGADETVAAILRGGGVARASVADAGRPEEAARMVDEATRAFGALHVLYNNAGVAWPGRDGFTPDIDPAVWDEVIRINLSSVFYCAHAAIPALAAAGGGSIINTASTAGVRPRPGLTWYNGSKGAVIALTKSMAVELAPRNIRVNAINPVIGETGLLEEFMGVQDTAENRAKFIAGIPLGRMSKPSDIANAAVFLADPASAFVTGVAIEVDGGRCI